VCTSVIKYWTSPAPTHTHIEERAWFSAERMTLTKTSSKTYPSCIGTLVLDALFLKPELYATLVGAKNASKTLPFREARVCVALKELLEYAALVVRQASATTVFRERVLRSRSSVGVCSRSSGHFCVVAVGGTSQT